MKSYIRYIKENIKIEEYLKNTELLLKKFNIVFDLLKQDKYLFYIDDDDNYIFYVKNLNRLFIDERIFNDFEYYFKNNIFYKNAIITSAPLSNRVFIKRLKSINENIDNLIYKEFYKMTPIDRIEIWFDFIDESDRLEIMYFIGNTYLFSYNKTDNYVYVSHELTKRIRWADGNNAICEYRFFLRHNFKYIDKNTEISFSD